MKMKKKKVKDMEKIDGNSFGMKGEFMKEKIKKLL